MKTDVTDEIMSLFFSGFRNLKKKLNINNPLFHLPFAQMETLHFVAEKKLATMKEIADFLAITPPSATVLMNNLVKLGYIQRASDKHDRRTVHLSLTKTGAGFLQKGVKQRCNILKKMTAN
jgi:DNA-binding MarR family transcriptional regulator